VHRRDREDTFKLLSSALCRLQDLLTESLLWRIQSIQTDLIEFEGGRSGVAGVVAELLGRLLVLEKEESQIFGLISKKKPLE
jgi:hypothetical protein